MEREILFRGKNNGEWVEGFYLYDGSREEHRITRYNSLLDKMVVYNILDKETIGQYSGLKDKEGKKIFEGDVIERDNILWIIKFDEKFGFVAKDMKGFSHIYAWYDRVKVIGNIYDNPELVIK
jgi:uncharacterized phage protein (TIGR01671 family)